MCGVKQGRSGLIDTKLLIAQSDDKAMNKVPRRNSGCHIADSEDLWKQRIETA